MDEECLRRRSRSFREAAEVTDVMLAKYLFALLLGSWVVWLNDVCVGSLRNVKSYLCNSVATEMQRSSRKWRDFSAWRTTSIVFLPNNVLLLHETVKESPTIFIV
jgi:hypothetical protein